MIEVKGLLALVFQFIETLEMLSSVVRTCRLWNGTAMTHRAVWRCVNLETNPVTSRCWSFHPHCRNLIDLAGSHLRVLKIPGSFLRTDSDFSASLDHLHFFEPFDFSHEQLNSFLKHRTPKRVSFSTINNWITWKMVFATLRFSFLTEFQGAVPQTNSCPCLPQYDVRRMWSDTTLAVMRKWGWRCSRCGLLRCFKCAVIGKNPEASPWVWSACHSSDLVCPSCLNKELDQQRLGNKALQKTLPLV
jgi:hypothetical protein